MTAIRRVAPPVAVLAVLGTALTACGSGPSQVNSAVIIGDRVISVDSVQQRLDTALKNEPAAKELAKTRSLDKVSRAIVSQLIRHELLTNAASREGLTVAEKDVSAYAAAHQPAADDLISKSVQAAFDPNELARDQLLVQALGHKYLTRLQVHLEGATVASQTNAKAVATDLAKKFAAAPDRVGQIVQAATGEEVNPLPVTDFNPVNTFTIFQGNQQQVLLTAALAVPERTAVAFRFTTGGQGPEGWVAGVVTKRDTNATLSAQDSGNVATVPDAWQMLVGQQLLGPLAAEQGVRISPRYGVWDELSADVAPSDGEKSGAVIAVSSPRP
jgi:hypothetical protein